MVTIGMFEIFYANHVSGHFHPNTNSYMLMRQCWNWNSHERPTFTEIVENLDQILGANLNDEYLDVGIPRLETPPSSDDEHDDDDDADSDAETLHEQSLLRYHHR